MAHVVRRSHARVPCDRRVLVFRGAAIGRRLGEGRLLDVSLAGAYLLFAGELERGTPYRLQAETADGPLDLPFRLAREGPRSSPKEPGARHYGLVFNLSVDQEARLRKLVDWLRRHPPIAEESRFDRSLRSYWEL